MNPESQAALASLEQELERLRSAVEHIEQAKTVAQKVIAAVGVIQKKYADHLDAMLEVQKEAVREAGTVQQVRFDELGAAARRHILESAARAKKYLEEYNAEVLQSIEASAASAEGTLREASQRAGDIIGSTGSHMEKLSARADQVIAQSGQRLEELTGQAAKQLLESITASGGVVETQIADAGAALRRDLNDLMAGVRGQLESLNETATAWIQESGNIAAGNIDEIARKAADALQGADNRQRAHVEELAALAKTSLRELQAEARGSVEEAGNHSKRIFAAIKKTQDQHSTEFEKVSVSTDALIAATGKLVRTIDAIDFPARMQSIEGDIRSLHYNLNSAMSRLDALEKANEMAMASFSEDVVAKLGRLEQYIDKSIRTHNDDMEKRLKQEEAQIGTMRMLLVILLVVNLVIAAGVYLVWSSDGDEAAQQPIEQLQVDSAATASPTEESAPPADAGTKKGRTVR
ncbi:MAG: hypothetical protein KFF77_04780 [Bacteroidetes bacterium]|nr:hypothetical protein [Bacteroidota bacterium]